MIRFVFVVKINVATANNLDHSTFDNRRQDGWVHFCQTKRRVLLTFVL